MASIQFDTVESCSFCPLGSVNKLLNCTFDVRRRHLQRYFIFLLVIPELPPNGNS